MKTATATTVVKTRSATIYTPNGIDDRMMPIEPTDWHMHTPWERSRPGEPALKGATRKHAEEHLLNQARANGWTPAKRIFGGPKVTVSEGDYDPQAWSYCHITVDVAPIRTTLAVMVTTSLSSESLLEFEAVTHDWVLEIPGESSSPFTTYATIDSAREWFGTLLARMGYCPVKGQYWRNYIMCGLNPIGVLEIMMER